MILTAVMAHQRKLIRKAVVALLIGANTSAGARVDGTRVEPHKKSLLPAIAVYTLSEETDEASANTAPIELTRHLKVEIAAWVAHSDAISVDDAMDDIAEQIESALASDYYIGATVADQMLESTEMEIVESDGRSDPLIGIVTLTYGVTYRTSEGATATDDFTEAKVTTQLVGGVTDTVKAVDTFNPQVIT